MSDDYRVLTDRHRIRIVKIKEKVHHTKREGIAPTPSNPPLPFPKLGACKPSTILNPKPAPKKLRNPQRKLGYWRAHVSMGVFDSIVGVWGRSVDSVDDSIC